MLDGDVPRATLGGVKNQSFGQEEPSMDDFVVINYNIHSLICFEERIVIVLYELGDRHWDVVVFTETWREEQSESWVTDHGHTWFGSGGSRGRCGVGYLLNRKLTLFHFNPISARVATLDVRSDLGVKWRIIGVYMPYSMQPQEDVDATYAIIDAEVAGTRQGQYNLIVAGDFNAEVGT